ncbi:MAG: thioredoxin domain-containing protein [archaeon]
MKKRTIFILITIVIAVFIVSGLLGYLNMRDEKTNFVRQKLQTGDTTYLYNFYISGRPNLDNRLYFGSPNASITFITYMDVHTPAAKYFMDTTFPNLTQDYIYTNQMRFYHKQYLTIDDYQQKTDTFIYANALACMQLYNKNKYYDFYFALFNTTKENIPALASTFNVSGIVFNNCLYGKTFDSVREDMMEVDNFGMTGVTPRIYVGIEGRQLTQVSGIPSYTRLKQIIRQYQIQLGQ